MKRNLTAAVILSFATLVAFAQRGDEGMVSPASVVVPTGGAPGMQFKLIRDTPEEKVYTIVFRKGDEAVSGLTDFAIAHSIRNAHLTAIGAASAADLGYLNLTYKKYRINPIRQQVEVLSLIGDIAEFNNKPILHMHTVLGKEDASTIGGHVFSLTVNPTLEVFLTANATPLKKRPDEASGMKLIDPPQ